MSRIDVSPLLARFVEARSKRADFYYGEKGPVSSSGVGFRPIYGAPETAGEYAQSVAGNLLPNTLLPGSAPQYSLGDAALAGTALSGATRSALNRGALVQAMEGGASNSRFPTARTLLTGLTRGYSPSVTDAMKRMTGRPDPTLAQLMASGSTYRMTPSGVPPVAANPEAQETTRRMVEALTNRPGFKPSTPDATLNIVGASRSNRLNQGPNTIPDDQAATRLRMALAGNNTASVTRQGTVPSTNIFGQPKGDKEVPGTVKTPKVNPSRPAVSGQTWRDIFTRPVSGPQNAPGRVSRALPGLAFAAPFIAKYIDDSMTNRGPGAVETPNGSIAPSGKNVGPAGLVEGAGRFLAPDVLKGKAPYPNRK
jgi:hypothetical protein